MLLQKFQNDFVLILQPVYVIWKSWETRKARERNAGNMSCAVECIHSNFPRLLPGSARPEVVDRERHGHSGGSGLVNARKEGGRKTPGGSGGSGRGRKGGGCCRGNENRRRRATNQEATIRLNFSLSKRHNGLSEWAENCACQQSPMV